MVPQTRQAFTKVNDEVYVSTDQVTEVSSADIAFLKKKAMENPRRRVRLCTHTSSDDLLHEMLIVHARGNYVPPHRHKGKSESFHIIEGRLKIVLFDDEGTIDKIIEIAASDPEAIFFYRLSAPIYHTVIPMTDYVIFHETTNGPFRREDMEFAPWAPPETASTESQQAYIEGLAI
jgi:cupin fold WbuC family metalloprotein